MEFLKELFGISPNSGERQFDAQLSAQNQYERDIRTQQTQQSISRDNAFNDNLHYSGIVFLGIVGLVYFLR